jgi:hypothetical protein
LLVLLTLAGALAHASDSPEPDDSFTLERGVVGAGGLYSMGGDFEIVATGGQPAAGPAFGMAVGVVAGFWGEPPRLPNSKYLPLVLQ